MLLARTSARTTAPGVAARRAPAHYAARSAGNGAGRASATTCRAVGGSAEYEALKGVTVVRASDKQPVELLSLWQAMPGTRVVLPFLTHFGDLSSWEYAQKLNKALPALRDAGLRVYVVGLGSADNAAEFSRCLDFPLSDLYADPDGACYSALGFSPGFAPDLDISPYAKLLPMLAGIGSPGTIQEVLRGYVGDRAAKPLFLSPSPFDILGKGYQRPFELATVRLINMVGILPKWSELCPPKTTLLTQQGGTLALDGTTTTYMHRDAGILKYTDVDEMVAAVTAPAPSALTA